jgi:chromosome partitioning protein
VELTTAIDHREERLKRELVKIKDKYDYVFIKPRRKTLWL